MAHGGSASNTTGGSAGTSLNVALAPSDGSRVLLAVTVGDATSATVTWPSGFTQIGTANATNQNQGKLGVMYVAEKKVASSEPGSYTISLGAAADFNALGVYFTGRHASDAAVVSNSSNPGSGTSPLNVVLTGVSAAAGDDVAYFAGVSWAAYTGTGTGTPPSSYTERLESDAGAGAFFAYLATRDNVSSGTTGNLTAVATNATQGGDYFGVVVALPVAASGAKGTVFRSPVIRSVM